MRLTKLRRSRYLAAATSASILVLAPVVAGPASAQDDPMLQASLTPTTVEPGGQLIYASVDPCPMPEMTTLHWSYGTEGWSSTEGGVSLVDGTVQLPEDASWTATITAPDEPGRYELVAVCMTDDDDPDNPGSSPTGRYPATDFEVVDADGADPTDPTPEPTAPLPGTPELTG